MNTMRMQIFEIFLDNPDPLIEKYTFILAPNHTFNDERQ